jgi:hypothetical protein
MTPFRLLGIPRNASETDIKRAYARKLKTTRPDDDPVAFQQLNDAYQAALEECRWRASMVEAGHEIVEYHNEERNEETSVTYEQPAPSAPEPTLPNNTGDKPIQDDVDAAPSHSNDLFHYDQFLVGIHEHSNLSPPVLIAWLNAKPELYSLQLKANLALALPTSFAQGKLQLSEPNLRALAQYFDYKVDYPLLDKMRARGAIIQEKTELYGELWPMAVRQLKRPFSMPRALLYAAIPQRSFRIVALSQRLQTAYGGAWPEQLNRQQHDFFAQLLDPTYFGHWRWAMIGVRAAIVGMMTWVLFVAFNLFFSGNLEGFTLAISAALTVAAIVVVWETFIAVLRRL